MCRQPGSTEATLRHLACIPPRIRSCGRTYRALRDAAQRLFQRTHLTAQVGNGCAMCDRCFLQRFNLGAHFFASYAGNFSFENRGDIWHERIVPFCSRGQQIDQDAASSAFWAMGPFRSKTIRELPKKENVTDGLGTPSRNEFVKECPAFLQSISLRPRSLR